MFIPVVLGMKYLYSGNGEELGWLNSPKTGEARVVCLAAGLSDHARISDPRGDLFRDLACAGVVVQSLVAGSRTRNREDRALRRRFKMLAGPGIILYVLAMTFAAIDWVMSLSPHWASTIYGFIFVAGRRSPRCALMIISRRAALRLRTLTPASFEKRHLHDLGKLLFAFNMLWAYFAFSQLLIIWSGNQPEEITFYRTRLYGGWGVVAVIVLLFSFRSAVS